MEASDKRSLRIRCIVVESWINLASNLVAKSCDTGRIFTTQDRIKIILRHTKNDQGEEKRPPHASDHNDLMQTGEAELEWMKTRGKIYGVRLSFLRHGLAQNEEIGKGQCDSPFEPTV